MPAYRFTAELDDKRARKLKVHLAEHLINRKAWLTQQVDKLNNATRCKGKTK
jgi:hypothetical protein